MTDKADEIARKIYERVQTIRVSLSSEMEIEREIASTLRSYRNEGLEEAAIKLEERGSWSSRTIRSLKCKEPQG